MKKYIVILGAITTTALIFLSCKKEYPIVAAGSNSNGQAFLKIVHASPNFAKVTSKVDGVNIFLDGAKINGPLLKFNSAFPAIGSVNTYATVPAGDHKVKISVGGVVNADSIEVTTLSKTLTAGSYYTLLITDNLLVPGDAGKIWAQDNVPNPAAGSIGLRFVDMVLNGTDADGPYLSSKPRNQTLFPAVLLDSISPFANFTTISTLDTFYVKLANVKGKNGSDSIAATLLMTATMIDRAAYTLYYIGDAKATGTTKRTLTYVQNK